MEQIKIITEEQKIILDEFRNDHFLRTNFYFTGGTALSYFYLQHRLSLDLDFFSEEIFDSQIILEKLYLWRQEHKFDLELKTTENLYAFNLTFKNNQKLKVDFAFYPYKRLERSKEENGLPVDSLLDIAVNKFLTISQREDVKDFVDLYFLLREFTVRDLARGVEVKFGMETDPLFWGSNFLKAEEFEFLPKMLIPFKLKELKEFFIQKAKEITEKVIEK